MRASEWKPYREGLVLRSQPGGGSYVDIGLDRMAHVPQVVALNTRVTLELGQQPTSQFMPDFGEHMIVGQVREAAGWWGDTVHVLSTCVAQHMRGCL
jgi:predicted SPOUT superfamily RNA methylase MTH1